MSALRLRMGRIDGTNLSWILRADLVEQTHRHAKAFSRADPPLRSAALGWFRQSSEAELLLRRDLAY